MLKPSSTLLTCLIWRCEMIVACPLCGRKHTDDFCFIKNKHIPDDVILFEFGSDERDDDFNYEQEQ